MSRRNRAFEFDNVNKRIKLDGVTIQDASSGDQTVSTTVTHVDATGNVTATGNVHGSVLVSDVTTGTPPLVVASTTLVGNLYVATALTAATVTTAAQPNITSVGTLSSLAVTGNVTGGNLITAGDVTTATVTASSTIAGSSTITATGNITGANLNTSGKVVATGDLNTTAGNVIINAQGQLRLYDADSSNYVAFRSPTTVGSNILWTLPSSDGTNGQVIVTNGAGTLSFADQSGGGGGGGGSSYPNSTITTLPGTDGNFDLSYNVAQTEQEVPFESGGTDPFGVNLGSVFNLMDPIGSVQDAEGSGLDLGVLT